MATGPTIAGFLTFIRQTMGINATVLPDDSSVIPMAYDVALEIVNLYLLQMSPLMYTLAVYNLGGSNVVNYAQDQPGQTYFAVMREKFNSLGFVSGVITSSGDEGTNQSLVVQEAAKNFTLANLQALKDPWGRQYLSIAQTVGPGAWGVS